MIFLSYIVDRLIIDNQEARVWNRSHMVKYKEQLMLPKKETG